MYPQLHIYRNGSDTAEVVQPLTVDFDVYEEILGNRRATNNGLNLAIAYIHLTGREPKTLTEVREWGRAEQVQVVIGEAPDPTQTAQSEG